MSSSQTPSTRQLMLSACRRFNKSDVAIPLCWHDPKVGMYYVCGIFPLDQSRLDNYYTKLAARFDESLTHRMGSGSTLEAACDALDAQIFGGL